MPKRKAAAPPSTQTLENSSNKKKKSEEKVELLNKILNALEENNALQKALLRHLGGKVPALPSSATANSNSTNRTAAVNSVCESSESSDEDEIVSDDVAISSKRSTIKTTCPWTGSNLQEPVQSKKCKHVYEKAVAFAKLRTGGGYFECPIIGCKECRITIVDLVESPSLALQIRKEIKRKEEEKRKKVESSEDC